MADDSAPTTQFPSDELEAVLNYYSSSVGTVLCLPSKYQKDDFDDDGGHAYILVVLAVQKVLGKLVARKEEDIRCCLEIQFEYNENHFRFLFQNKKQVFRLF